MTTTSYIDPNADGPTSEWDDDAYTRIDDGVRQPTTPTLGVGEEVEDRDKSGELTQEWGLENLAAVSGETTTFVKLWLFQVSGGDAANTNQEVKFAGTWRGTFDASGNVGSWYWYRWDIAVSIDSGATTNGLRVKSGVLANGESGESYGAAYVEIESEPDVTPQPVEQEYRRGLHVLVQPRPDVHSTNTGTTNLAPQQHYSADVSGQTSQSFASAATVMFDGGLCFELNGTSHDVSMGTWGSIIRGIPAISSAMTDAQFGFFMWIKPTSVSVEQTLLSTYNGSDAHTKRELIMNTSGKLTGAAGDGVSASVTLSADGTALVANQWNHVGLTLDTKRGDAKRWLNGIQTGVTDSLSTLSSLHFANGVLPTPVIGSENSASKWFGGRVRGVELYSYAPQAPEVQRIYRIARTRPIQTRRRNALAAGMRTPPQGPLRSPFGFGGFENHMRGGFVG